MEQDDSLEKLTNQTQCEFTALQIALLRIVGKAENQGEPTFILKFARGD